MRKQNFYSLITIVSISILLASCASKVETHEDKPQISPERISEALAKADALFKQRNEDPGKLREAVRTLDKVRNADQRDYEIEWKFAKYSYFLGKQTEKEAEKEKAFKEGANAGIIASRIEPDKPEGHFWYGANLGEQAKLAPLTKGITSVDDIRETMNKVIKIQPDYQGASAFDALAQIEMATRLTGGKPEKAVEYLEKALEYEKDNTYIRLHLAEAYLAVQKEAEARKQLEYLLQMKPDPDYLPEYKETTEEAKRLLRTRF